MKIAATLSAAAFAVFASSANAASTESQLGRKFLLIPSSQPKQKLTEAMQAQLTRLKEEDSLSKLNTWNRLMELPAWVFEKEQKPEIAYLGSIPSPAMDAFRYAVITSTDQETIVVRAGGFAGVYEIFQRKKEAKPGDATPASQAAVADPDRSAK